MGVLPIYMPVCYVCVPTTNIGQKWVLHLLGPDGCELPCWW